MFKLTLLFLWPRFYAQTSSLSSPFVKYLYHWVILYLERARQSLFSQAVEAKNMADFWRIITPFDAISRHLTPYLWQRLKVVTASQAQFWACGGFHTPLDVMLIFFAVNFFVNENDFDEFFGTFTIYSNLLRSLNYLKICI